MAEGWRKLYRCAGLIFPILYIFYSKNLVLGILSILTFMVIIIEILRFNFPSMTKKYFKYFGAIAKKKEKDRISGTTYVLVAILLIILFFEQSIAIAAIFFLILGDAAASLFGQKYGRTKILNKSLEGSLAMFVVCLISGFFLLWIGLDLTPNLVIVGSLAATAAELIPLKKKSIIDDNLTIGIISGLVMLLLRII